MVSLSDANDELAYLESITTQQRGTGRRTGTTYDEHTGTFTVPTEAQGARLFALVHDLDQMQQQYWWLKPVLQYAMGQTGIAPDSKTAKIAAEIGAKVEADQGFGFQPPGTTVKAALMAAGTAVSGQGAGYAGSYDWGSALRDLSRPDTQYVTHYLDNNETQTDITANGVSIPATDTSPEGRRFLESQGVKTGDPDALAARDAAKATIAQYADRTDLSQEEHARYFQAQRIVGMNDQEYKDSVAAFGSGVVPVLRTGFMVLDAPLQELQGEVRNVYGLTHGQGANFLESQSDLGVAAGDVLGGRPVDVGSGVFVDPESAVPKERNRRAAERGLIGGNPVTLGRWGADLVFEPGSKPFNTLSGAVDLGVALYADPAAHGLAKVGKLREESKLFTEAGGILGTRRTVSPQAVTKWLDGEDGQRVVSWLANKSDFYDVWEGLGRKVEPEVAVKLADAQTPADVLNILRPQLGVAIREKPDPSTLGGLGRVVGITGEDRALGAVRTTQRVRMSNIVPGTHVDLEDPAGAVTQVERFLRNVKANDTMVYDFTERMARAPDRVARFGVLEDMLSDTKGLLVSKWGVNPERAKQLTRMFSDSSAEARKYFIDDIGNTVTPWNRKMTVDGELVDLPSPHLLAEHIDRLVPLPDARQLRRATSKLAPIWSTSDKQLRLPLATMQSFQDNFWKPAALFRGAWTIRVVGEEQMRMAWAGVDSLFAHPLSALAWITGRKGSTSLLDETFDSIAEHQAALTRGSGGFLHRPGKIETGDYAVAYKTDEQSSDYLRGWAGEIAQLHADPVSRRVAQWDNLDDAKAWFRNSQERQVLSRAGRDGHAELLTDGGADSYIESVARRISIKTGDHPDLLEAVKTGRLNGEAMSLMDQGRTQLNRRFVDRLGDHLDSGPRAVKTPRTRFVKGDALKERYDRVVESAFGFLMSKPSNKLSRSPTFRQAYWDRVGELMPLMTVDAQQEALKAAEAANLSGDTLKLLRNSRATVGELSIEGADVVAKGHALDYTRNLLYDMAERSQFFDATRLLFPFGEAWKEIFTRYAKLSVERPQGLRRFQQIVEGARGPGFGSMIGAPTGQGFFYKNDRGEEVFCVDTTTEALTQRGWVAHDQLRDDDLLLSLDPDSDSIRWEPLISVHRFDYDGPMVQWSGRVDALTTPNHRWLVEDWRLNKAKNDTAPRRSFKTTEWLSARHQRQIVVAGGTPQSFASFPTYSDEFVELLGWVITEGCYDKRGNAITITQSEGPNLDKVERLRRLLKHFADQGATCTEWSKRRGDQCTFYLGRGIATNVRRAAPGKQLTPELLCALTRSQADLLLETLLDGDGHRRPDGYRQWIQHDVGRIASFQMLCAMLGIRTSMASPKTVSLQKVRHLYTTNAKTVDYHGVVWCPRVSTGVWFARRNGSTYWTGNTYPGSQWLTSKMIGVPVPLVGRVNGLNMIGNIFPALGPMAQIPAAWLVPDQPQFDDISNLLFPYGRPGGPLEKETWLPAWANRVLSPENSSDPDTLRTYSNSVMDVARYLASTGEYDTSTPEGVQKLLEDAKSKAKTFAIIRGVAQSFAPSAPAPDFLIKDKSGALVRMSQLASEYRALQNDDYETASQKFLDAYGTEPFLLMQAKTQSVSYGYPTDSVGLQWMREHPELEGKFPNVFGFFAPRSDDPNDFDYNAYLRALQSGAKDPLTPQQFVLLGNARLASVQYDQAKKQVEEMSGGKPSDSQRAWLRDLQDALIREFPGYGQSLDGGLGLKERADKAQLVRELTAAVADPVVAQSDVGQAAKSYLDARDQAQASATAGGLAGFQTAKSARGIRDWLRQIGEALKREHPGFAPLWEQVLSREMSQDTDVEKAAA